MPYRPYPNAHRALRQLDRHHVPQPVPASELTLRLSEQATACLAAAHEALLPFRKMVERLQSQPYPKSGQFALLDS
ncbi:hypothetical protein OHA37_27155 [Streptomyces sp. NBC_00335]|uniref:hypothetical protein n=1 Tax=unclassified Streptomyces TaxID=2593676 RepID=UPI00225226AD|nr:MULTISPECIES: hypothetical protein [unclassified Streptomyces]MCX5407530.1 hypothetical protein [Streptomyces sp. NBC_00086]